MKYYLAYGSNLNKEQMAVRCPGAEVIGTSVIMDYQLVFRRGVLTIEPKKGSSVPVGIWKISEGDELRLDRYEGYPHFYYKKWFPININGQDIFCMAYIMTKGHPIKQSSMSYMRTVRQGYHDFGFNTTPLTIADIRAFDYVRRHGA